MFHYDQIKAIIHLNNDLWWTKYIDRKANTIFEVNLKLIVILFHRLIIYHKKSHFLYLCLISMTSGFAWKLTELMFWLNMTMEGKMRTIQYVFLTTKANICNSIQQNWCNSINSEAISNLEHIFKRALFESLC